MAIKNEPPSYEKLLQDLIAKRNKIVELQDTDIWNIRNGEFVLEEKPLSNILIYISFLESFESFIDQLKDYLKINRIEQIYSQERWIEYIELLKKEISLTEITLAGYIGAIKTYKKCTDIALELSDLYEQKLIELTDIRNSYILIESKLKRTQIIDEIFTPLKKIRVYLSALYRRSTETTFYYQLKRTNPKLTMIFNGTNDKLQNIISLTISEKKGKTENIFPSIKQSKSPGEVVEFLKKFINELDLEK